MLDNVREFSLKELEPYDLEIALENTGYKITDDEQFPGGGIQKSKFAGSFFGTQGCTYVYECKFFQDGSFDEDDDRTGNIYVHIDLETGKIKAEW